MATQRPSTVNPMPAKSPSPEKELDRFASRLNAQMAVITSGHVFGVEIPHALKRPRSNLAPPYLNDPEAIETARNNMSPLEISQYDAWSNGTTTLPTLSLSRSRHDVDPSETQLMSQYAVAMQRIWKAHYLNAKPPSWTAHSLTAEHASWATHNLSDELQALISAVVKVNAAQCDLLVRQKGCSAESLEFNAVQCIFNDNKLFYDNYEWKYKADFPTQMKRIHDKLEIIRLHRNALRRKVRSPKDKPVKRARVAAGLKPIDADIDYTNSFTMISTTIHQPPTQSTDNMATHRPSAAKTMVSIDPTKELELLVTKIEALTAVVMSGHSFAVRIPFSHFSEPYMPDPEAMETARDSMTPMEIRQYDVWKNGATMPTIDWSRSCEDFDPSERQLMSQRAVAMQRIWRNDFLSAGHASWLTHNQAYTLPLVSAIIKINAAQCDLLARQKGRTAEELDVASVQSILRIVKSYDEDLARYNAQRKMLAERFHHASEILRIRRDALKAKMMGVSPKDESINRARIAAGLKPIGADIDYTNPFTTGSRDATTATDVLTRRKRSRTEEEEA